MQFIVPLQNKENIQALRDAGAKGIIIQNDDITPRPVKSYTKEDMEEIVSLCKQFAMDVYLHLNIMMHQTHVKTVKDYLSFAKTHQIDGIIFGDIGVYQLAKELGIHDKLIFQPGTLTTNAYDANFWHKNNIKGMFVAREITTDEVLEIAKNSPINTAMIGHGYLNMFHSKRPLITNFLTYQKERRPELFNNYEMTLIEEKRQDKFPIFENTHGTHVFRAKPMHSFHVILALKETIDLFMIDSIFQSDNYTINVLKDYQTIIKAPSKQDAVIKKYQATHDTGFLDKSTVYDTF